MSFKNSQSEDKVKVENVKVSDKHSLYINLDDVSSENDDFEPISSIVKRMVENNKNPTKTLNPFVNNDQQ